VSIQQFNHTEIAEEIYEYLRYEYKFLTHKGMSVDKCKQTLANKLKKLTSFEALCWSDALDEIAKTPSDNAPTPVEIIRAIQYQANQLRPIAKAHEPVMNINDFIDYEDLWKRANDKAKFRFFIDHKFTDVPSYVRYWFRDYNKLHRGWTPYESTMMVGYWATPYHGAKEGAMLEHQRAILKYFEER
tara:strand:+ start:544 stop:1104 length:561 start_codon:yes stop_codon:yes gene_type:complete